MPAGPIADGHNEPAINPPQGYPSALKGDIAPVLPPLTSKPIPVISVTEFEKKNQPCTVWYQRMPKRHTQTLQNGQ